MDQNLATEDASTATIETCLDEAARIAAGGVVSPRHERRRHKRFPFDRDLPVLWLSDLNGQGVINLRVADISAGGMGLSTRQMLYTGARGAVQLTRGDGATVVVGIEVMHCRYVGEMRYLSGCRFVATPAEIEKRIVQTDGGPALR